MQFRILTLVALLLTLTVGLFAFPGWLKNPHRKNAHDPLSDQWSPPVPLPTSTPTPVPANQTFHVHLRDFYGAHAGQSMGFRLAEQPSGLEVANQYFPITGTGAVPSNVSVAFPALLLAGKNYNMDLLAEYVTGTSGFFDPLGLPNYDHSYRVSYSGVSSDINLEFTHSGGFTDIAYFNFGARLPAVSQGYNLKVSMTGFTPHVGQVMVFRLRDAGDLSTRVIFKVQSLGYPNHEILIFTGLKNGHAYEFDFFADFNSNGLYDGLPVDHSWRLNIPTVSADVDLSVDHATGQIDIGPISVP